MSAFVFDWFGTHVRIASNSRSFLRHLGVIFQPVADGRPGRRPLRYDIRRSRGRAPSLLRRREVLALDPRQPEVHAGRILLADLLARTGGLFVLHGIALAKAGRALVVSAPSGFGKTTLAVHLAGRGFSLLTDDIVGFDRATGRVLPFPKALGLRPGTRRLLPAGIGARARRARTGVAATGGEWTVDPITLLGPLAPPAPLSLLVVVRPPGSGSAARRFPVMQLRFVPGQTPRLDVLRAIPGVEAAWADADDPDLLAVRFADGGGLERYVHRHRKGIVLALKRPPGGPRFDGPPRIWPIGPFQAAIELGQEMVNRGHGSRLEREFRGREAHLVIELAALLRHCRCYAMTPGRLDTTLAMLERRFAAGPA